MLWLIVIDTTRNSKVEDIGDALWVSSEVVEFFLISETLTATSTCKIVLRWWEGHDVTTSNNVLKSVIVHDCVESLWIVLVEDVDVVLHTLAVDLVGYESWFSSS